MRNLDLLKKKKPYPYSYVITKEKPLSPISDAYQKVLANLFLNDQHKDSKVIQFVSVGLAQSQVSVMTNLGHLLALEGKKVCLMDVDFRNPQLVNVFQTDERVFINDYLDGKQPISSLIKQSKTLQLDYVLSSSTFSLLSKTLASPKWATLIEELKTVYDIILINTPPLDRYSDALYVSKWVDGLLFLVEQGKVKRPVVNEALEALKRAQVPLMGLILTETK